MYQCQCLCLYLRPAAASEREHSISHTLMSRISYIFHVWYISPLTKRKTKRKEKRYCVQIQDIYPGSHVKQWTCVKRNLWRSDKRNLGYLSPSNKIVTILCFISTGYKYLLHCQTKFPDKKFVGFFWLVLLPGIRQPERKYRIYSTESYSVSIGNMWVELNTFRNWHIVLVRIHSCSRSGIVKQLCLRCATVWPPEQRDRRI